MILTLKSFFPAIDKHYHYSYIQLPDVATIKDLYKVACAETGISITSPVRISRNGCFLSVTDSRTLFQTGILPYDIIDLEIMTRGSKYSSLPVIQVSDTSMNERPLKRTHECIQSVVKKSTPFLFEIVKGVERIGREPIVIDYELEGIRKRGKRVFDSFIENCV